FAADGWSRGVATLRAGGDSAAVAARAWFALAVEGAPRDPMAQSLLLYCEAARDHDAARQQRVADHVRALGVPPALAPVFGG
ncbi:MAG TPA: hypothetical protein VFA35_01365, partial [Burkholderiaceae bacterium]|nr:hypothetical protein [Burkholderiaceae bacterium]